MRVLVNAVSARTGGIATHTESLVRNFSQRNIAAKFFVPGDFAERIHSCDSVEVNEARSARYRSVQRLLWEQTLWRQEVRRSNANVLFSAANFGLIKPGIPQLLLIREGGLFNPLYIRHILPRLTARHKIETNLRRRLMLTSARNSDVVMFPSESVRDWVLRYCPELETRTFVNSYGPGITPVAQAENPLPWRTGGTLRLLFVSVYYPHKDPLCLARATEILNQRGLPAHARITMKQDDFVHWSCGPADYAALMAAARGGYVEMGAVPHHSVGQAYKDCDVAVFPSVSETFGFPLLEAMAIGRPSVVADTIINREICGDAALYYPPFDAGKLADRLQQLDARPDLRQHLVQEGLKRVRDKFSWDRHIEGLIATLARIQRKSL
jgi:glycosyltransferase involved in cell wall biosynthesis